jgi:hypothetical protein
MPLDDAGAADLVPSAKKPTLDDLPGGWRYARRWAEAEAVAATNEVDKWHRLTNPERVATVVAAAVTEREVEAQVKRAGFESMEAFLAATEHQEPLPDADKRAKAASGDLDRALTAVESFLRRYVVLGRREAVAPVVLWVAHCHCIERADVTPYLNITSPSKGSGKTRLQECLRLLTPGRPEVYVIPTASTIFRMLEAAPTTPLLLDELDAVFRDNGDRYEEVRALINAGHRRGAKVPRTVRVGGRHEVRFFSVFGAKALSGIGRLPDTIADRAIPILMLKRKPTEAVERFREAKASREALPVVEALAAAIAARPPAREASVPPELPDRAADAWEPLLAIAEAAGGSWPARARQAAVVLHADRADDESLALRLLADIRHVFDRLGVDRFATAALISALRDDEESPWASDHHPLTPERLARHLRPFSIQSIQMKIDGVKVRGFSREGFVDTWERYLSTG